MNQISVELHRAAPAPLPPPLTEAQPSLAAPPTSHKHEERLRSGGLERLLMITSIAGAQNCATSLGVLLATTVDTAPTRRDALTALRGQEYTAVIVDDAIGESDPQGAELLRRSLGGAVVLEVNFAISGVARLARQVRAEIERCDHQHQLAMRRACSAIESELKASVAGLLLQAQLALVEPGISSQLSTRLHGMVESASNLRHRLESPFHPMPFRHTKGLQ